MIPLSEYLESQYEATPDQRFMIDSIDKAEWAVKKIGKYRGNIDQAKTEAQAQIDKINTWLAAVTEENQKQIEFFTGMLAPFADEQLADAKKKSLKLPSGVIGFRKNQPKVEYDESVLLPWCKDNAKDFVKTKETVLWGEFNKTLTVADDKALTTDGEIIPGIVAAEQPDTFYVKSGDD
jgi:phage host-nuclease inhibitor protein Gam